MVIGPGQIGVKFIDRVAPALRRCHKDILASKDTDPKSPTYGQKLREFWLRGGRGCVDGDTLIDTENGPVRVRDFKGGLVWSYLDDGTIGLRKAHSATIYTRERMYLVTTHGGGHRVVCTDEHRFLTENRGWVMTKDLIVGVDKLVFRWMDTTGAFAVESVEYAKTDYYWDVYVEGTHNYISNGIVSHNSCKSSLISLEIVRHIVESPKSNAVVFVKVAENIRDSVYKQIIWAIDHLELTSYFKCTTSPFRCVYTPTGQEILFRGLDKAGKIKGIKPTVGYFDMIWFEELTEFNGMEDCRSVVQSVLRGGDEEDDEIGENVRTWEFYSYNPPPTLANWVNVEANKIVPGRKVYDSNYLSVPMRWLRKDFFVRAAILKESNPRAYAHEYLGWVTGTGGNIFNNLEIRRITDEEILTRFDNRCFGLDWGFANDPFVWLAMNYDRNHQTLYIFDEIVCLGKRTQETAELVRKKMERIGGGKTVYADCAEPDSIADFNAWGVKCEGCPKPHSSKWSGRDYEFKALQDLKKIVIDPVYCPKTAAEFQKLEYPKNPHGDFKSEYPHSDPADACLVGSTKVMTPSGWKYISDMVGTEGLLLGYDENEGIVKAVKYINCRLTRRNAEILHIELSGREGVYCTEDHRILTDRGYVEAGELKIGIDKVMCWDGLAEINRKVFLPHRENVYDLEVPATHNLIVNDGLILHNCRYGTFWALREAGILTI